MIKYLPLLFLPFTAQAECYVDVGLGLHSNKYDTKDGTYAGRRGYIENPLGYINGTCEKDKEFISAVHFSGLLVRDRGLTAVIIGVRF